MNMTYPDVNMLKLRRRKKWIFVFAVTYCVCCLILIMFHEFSNNEIIIGTGKPIPIWDIMPFEPALNVDFPTIYDTFPRIPKIIHQTWKDFSVPAVFHENVRSFTELNPDFEYYFWTDSTARELLVEKYPELLSTYNNYVEPVRKADLLRYVVLYEFGGVYADLDTICLRPLARILYKYSCVISPEPYEHASLIYNSMFMVTNSIMFCRQYHPFLRKLMDELPKFSHFSQDIDASGPNFLTYHLDNYKQELNAGQKVDELHDNNVYIPSSQYFQNEIDPVRFDQFRKMCRNFMKLNRIGRTGCVSLKRRGMVHRSSSKYMFTKHSFYHTGYKWIQSSAVNISDIVPHVAIFISL